MSFKFGATIGTVVLALAAALVYRQVSAVMGGTVVAAPTTAPAGDGPLKFTMNDIDGKPVNLADYKGHVVMIVNVASKCGFTPQYEGLEGVYKRYQDRGLVILGFPANNFNSQEPGSDADIKQFCSNKYDVTFPMFSKVSVKGDDQTPLYQFLTGSADGQFAGPIGWNFTKFLIDKQGHVYARFASAVKPQSDEMTAAIEKGLAG